MIPQAVAASPEDTALARRIAQCDEHAFVALMRRHNRMLYRLARSILKDEADAEEAVQEAYFAAYRNMASFRGGSRLSTWLGSDEKTERPDAAAMRTEVRRLLERKIDQLPEQFRTVFMLREVEELSVEETAECLDVPAATVRTRAFRARALLRESLAQEVDSATADAFGFDGANCDRVVAAVLARLRLSAPEGELPAPDNPA